MSRADDEGGGDTMPMQMQDLQDLFVHKLQDLYDAEQQGLKAYRQVLDKVQTPELKQGIEQHIEESQGQVQRLEQIMEMLGETPGGEKCAGMQGLVQEGQKLMNQDAAPEVLEAGLIAASQAMEHYEIAGYGTARTYAQLLGNEEAAQLLGQSLEEEKKADQLLTRAAEKINVEAVEA